MNLAKRKVSLSLDEDLVAELETINRSLSAQVNAAVRAEIYRGPRQNQVVDACLARETGIRVRETDRALARLVGGVLAAAGVGSQHLADAHVIATAVDLGGGLALTSDPEDFERLAAAYRNVLVVGLP